MEQQFDVVIIGAGPAGESAAVNSKKQGLRTAIVDAGDLVGGSCTHRGTIPSKALRQTVYQMIRNRNTLGYQFTHERYTHFSELLGRARDVIRKQVKMRSKFYLRNEIPVFDGWASFTGSHELTVQSKDGNETKLVANKFIIATGARPWHPADVDFSHPCVFDSDTILDMDLSPHKVIIYGAGVIGCEYASIFCGLGIKVELINNRDRLLEFLDDEISDALAYHLRELGVNIRHRETYQAVTTTADGVCLELQSGKKIYADCFLWSNGRSGNTNNMNLEAVGITPDNRGQIKVNEHYQSVEAEQIYAAGDVIGWPSLASAAYNQGRAASLSLQGEDIYFVNDVPTGIYTIPEISSVGKTERELTEECVPYEVGRAFFKGIARAQISGEDVGMLKILFHAESYEILGIHCFGSAATEIIHIGQAIMKQQNGGNDIRYFINTTFNYPTMAEAYRVAALNGVNRLAD